MVFDFRGERQIIQFPADEIINGPAAQTVEMVVRLPETVETPGPPRAFDHLGESRFG
jgi:hypothetical protein